MEGEKGRCVMTGVRHGEKIKVQATLDADIVRWLDRMAGSKRLKVSTYLNSLLAEMMDASGGGRGGD